MGFEFSLGVLFLDLVIFIYILIWKIGNEKFILGSNKKCCMYVCMDGCINGCMYVRGNKNIVCYEFFRGFN